MPDLQPSLIRLDGDFAPVRRVVELLRDAGGRPLLVGGCVRDALMKVPVLDVDIEVYGLGTRQVEAALRKEFEDTLDKLDLSEIYQGSHTRVSSHQGSSRLDRFYTSLSLAEKCVVMPETLLPHHPHLPGSDSRVSDHFPVSLSFGRQLAKHSRFRIPEWAARHPLFLQAARERVAGLPTGRGHPVRRLCHAKRAIRQCAIDFIKTNSVTAHSKADGITLGLSVLKAARSAPPPPISHLRTSAGRNPDLLSALDKDVNKPDPSFKHVQDFVRQCYSASPLTVL